MEIEILTDLQLEALLRTIDEILRSRPCEHLQLEVLMGTIDEILESCTGEHAPDAENGEGIGSGT